MSTVLLVLVVVVAGTGGDMAVSHVMKQIGEVRGFSPSVVLQALARAFHLKWMWIGIALMAVGFFSLLVLLSREDVSFVVPATALSYAVGALGARFLLGEQVSKVRWAGVLLVCAGVALVWMG